MENDFNGATQNICIHTMSQNKKAITLKKNVWMVLKLYINMSIQKQEYKLHTTNGWINNCGAWMTTTTTTFECAPLYIEWYVWFKWKRNCNRYCHCHCPITITITIAIVSSSEYPIAFGHQNNLYKLLWYSVALKMQFHIHYL